MKTLSDYMKMNYRMEIVEDAEEGGFAVSFPELPGCFTCGDTKEKAIANAIDAKRAWLDRKSTRLNSSHKVQSRMPSSA